MATAEKNDYISLSFTPNQLNKSINMKSASERYSLLNSMSFQHPIASDISMVTIDYHSLITDGGFIVTRDGDKIEGYAEMTSAATGRNSASTVPAPTTSRTPSGPASSASTT